MSKFLIVYYSYSGNTRKIAKKVQAKTGGDLLELRPVKPYEGSYDEVVNLGYQEVENDVRPALINDFREISQYNYIILCSPIWWYTLAPVVKSFLGQCDLRNKEIIPIITNGGYGLGKSLTDLKKLAPMSKINLHIEVVFDGDEIKSVKKSK